MMPKLCLIRLTKLRPHRRPYVPKPEQFWSTMRQTFGSQDAKMIPKVLTKLRQHDRPDMSKLDMFLSIMMPCYGSEDAKIIPNNEFKNKAS